MKNNNKNFKKIDSDNDGLSDFEEINIYKTDPNNPDTDGDGISDGEEIRLGLNPLIWDYFIPNKNNNYRPHALKPKRLFFYGISALIVKLIVIVTVSAVPLLAFFSPDYISQESKKIVSLTNEIRKSLNLNILEENKKLTQSAMWKAEDMAIKQYFSHVSPDGIKLSDWLIKSNYDYKFGGENLAMGFSSAEDVMSAWYRVASHYKNIIDPDFKEIGVGISTGNYNNIETTFIAQYFASSDSEDINTQNNNLNDDNINTDISILNSQDTEKDNLNSEVLAEKQTSEDKTEIQKNIISPKISNTDFSNKEPEEIKDIMNDNVPPILYREKTKIFINESSSNDYVIMAEVYLSDDTKTAQIFVYDYKIELIKDENVNTKWTGHLIINDKEISQSSLSVSLIALDNSGNQLVTDIDWQNIVPIKSSLSNEYSFLKYQKNSPVNKLFDLSIIYYKTILILSIILLLINIFVKIKKQHIDIIASSVFLIIFLILLILF